MKNTIKSFGAEAKLYGKVYWNSFLAVAVFALIYTIVSNISGKQLAIIEKGDAVLKTGVTEVQATK